MSSSLGVFVLVGICIVLAPLWMLSHVVGLIMYLRSHAPEMEKLPGLAIATWVTSVAGGFFGPLVILSSIVSMIMALVVLARVRAGDMTRRARIPALTVIVAGLCMLVLAASIVAWLLVFSPRT